MKSIILLVLIATTAFGFNIGEELNSIPFDYVFGGTLISVAEAQGTANDVALKYIYSCFSNDTGKWVATNIGFTYTKTLGNGTEQTSQLSVPLLTMLPLPLLTVEELTIKFNFNIEINYRQSYSQATQAEVSLSAGGWFFPRFSGRIATQTQYSSTYSEKKTYSLEVFMKAARPEPPVGIQYIIDTLAKSATDSASD